MKTEHQINMQLALAKKQQTPPRNEPPKGAFRLRSRWEGHRLRKAKRLND